MLHVKFSPKLTLFLYTHTYTNCLSPSQSNALLCIYLIVRYIIIIDLCVSEYGKIQIKQIIENNMHTLMRVTHIESELDYM